MEDARDVITRFKFGDDRLRGLASAEGQILPLSIDFDGRPYNTLTLCPLSLNSHILHERTDQGFAALQVLDLENGQEQKDK